MATTTNITTTYAGQHAKAYISAALFSGNTLANKAIEVKQNIYQKWTIDRLETSGLLQDANCDFTASGTVTKTERSLTPKDLDVNIQQCKTDWASDWAAEQMGYSRFRTMPKNLSDYIAQRLVAGVADAIETSIWTGDATNSGEFNGIATRVAVDADLPAAQEVAGTTVTSANVITELGKMIDAAPDRVYSDGSPMLYIPINIAKAYVRALGGFGASGLGANGVQGAGTQWFNNQQLSFDGVPIFVAQGMTANTGILTYKENLWYGCGEISDNSEVKIIDMADIDGSKNFRFVMNLSGDANYGVVEDIVTYGITNAAN